MSGLRRSPNAKRRGGFTLVEMLVSVALVVLMMLMFAEIFGLASNAVSTQKGAAVNDQKVRTFTTLLNNDIKSRTFRTVMPFASMTAALPAAIGRYDVDFAPIGSFRQGYFAISENDPNDPTDDVLAFTIEVDQDDHGYEDAILYGRAVGRGDGDDLDQPEFDDGVAGDDQGASTMAEVAYFLRNGNLCRSVMLIREPHVKGSPHAGPDDQPNDFAAGSPPITNPSFDDTELQFWRDFDYSAFRHPTTSQVVFHTEASLNNSLTAPKPLLLPDGSNVAAAAGIPHLRWGHTINGNGGNGAPDEFIGGTFIGRFLKQEMADPDFDYPGIGAASPAATATWNASKSLVAPYDDLSLRRGEELLVPYVHEFDIQVWDDGVTPPRWTELGGTSGGFYDAGSNANTSYSPVDRYRFDTWHPQLGDPPPFRPFRATGAESPDGRPGVRDFDDDGDGGIDFERNPPGTGPYIGDINGNGVLDSSETWVEDAEEVGWIGSDDERPLRQIRIRVRFFDIKSGQVRQLTLTLPLTEAGSR